MINALRHAFGENVRTPEPRIEIDGLEFTYAGIRAIIANLRTRNSELETRCLRLQDQNLALLKENNHLKKEVNTWINDWVKVPVKHVDIRKA